MLAFQIMVVFLHFLIFLILVPASIKTSESYFKTASTASTGCGSCTKDLHPDPELKLIITH